MPVPTMKYDELMAEGMEELPFSFIDPPFNLNAPVFARFPVEVSGYYLLKALCRQLGWSGLADRRLLDFGCGVRFARTIINMGLDVGEYVGVDTNPDIVAWLSANVTSPRLRFWHLDMQNPFYNPDGPRDVNPGVLRDTLGLFDATCMFSVITHQAPADTKAIFQMLRLSVVDGGGLYFTALLDEAVDGFEERDPDRPGHLCYYHPDFLLEIVEQSGWTAQRAYPPSHFQMNAFLCRRL